MKYKIVIFDIGGTLFDKKNSNIVSKSIINDIINLRRKGIKVGVCSMRTIKYCKEVVPTELDFYISLNGSFVICNDNVVVDCIINELPSVTDFLSYSSDIAFYSSTKAKVMADKYGFIAQKKGIAKSIYNLVLFDVKENDLCDYNKYHYEYWPSTKTLMLQNINTSKVNGIAQVLKYYNIEQPILYFGDGPNDLDVFKTYSDCICMGSCYPLIENYALFKTDTCQNDGISKALRKLKII